MYLLDTNILSEFSRARPSPSVLAWYERQSTSALHLSVFTMGEIAVGIARQRRKNPPYAERLSHWLEGVARTYAGRILPFDLAAAEWWGRQVYALGHDSVDLKIAATARTRGLTVVTRNVRHFEPTGVPVHNPFED